MPRGPCVIHCPGAKGADSSGVLLVVGVPVGAAVLVSAAVAWLTANWPLVLVSAVVTGAAVTGVLRLVYVVSHRASVMALRSGTLAFRLAGHEPVAGEVQVRAEVQRRAIAAPPLAIEGPKDLAAGSRGSCAGVSTGGAPINAFGQAQLGKGYPAGPAVSRVSDPTTARLVAERAAAARARARAQ